MIEKLDKINRIVFSEDLYIKINEIIDVVNAHEKKIGCEHEWALNETKTEIECSKCGAIQVL